MKHQLARPSSLSFNLKNDSHKNNKHPGNIKRLFNSIDTGAGGVVGLHLLNKKLL